MLNPTDNFLVNDGSITETVTWSEIKGGINPLVVSVVITPNEPVVNEEVTATPVMTGGEEPYTITGYQWHTSFDNEGLNQIDILGATESTYTPVSANANLLLGCTVTATDANGVSVEGTGYAEYLTDMGLEIDTPSVLTPPDGAGIGGDVTYTPKTSAITDVVDVPGGWETKDAPILKAWIPMAYNGSILAMAALNEDSDQFASSTDLGTTWNTKNGGSGFKKYWKQMLFSPNINKFILIGNDAGSYTSSNGLDWSLESGSLDSQHKWYDADINGNTIVAVNGQASTIAAVQKSTDGGITWGPAFKPFFESIAWGTVTYGNGKWVAGNVANKVDMMYSTDDGDTWTRFDGPTKAWWYGSDYGDGRFMFCGSAGQIATSTSGDPGSFELKNVGENINITSIASNNAGTWVTTASQWIFVSTDNGDTWTKYHEPGKSFSRVIWTGTEFIINGDGQTDIIYLSPTGLPGATQLTLTDANTYNADDGTDMGQPISETFSAGQTVYGESATGTYGTETAAFSTTLYTGNGGTQQVPTGIDNSSKSLIWCKIKSDLGDHSLVDNVRTGFKALKSNTITDEHGAADITSFDSDGFTTGHKTGMVNSNNAAYVAWNFRAAPGFFDIVTYKGNGGFDLTVPHSLGSKPGMIIVKGLHDGGTWYVYHQETGLNYVHILNKNNAAGLYNGEMWGHTEPTETEFTVNSNATYQTYDYVAYLFADTPGKIKCGQYDGTGSGGTGEKIIETGFACGWVMIKSTKNEDNWKVFWRGAPEEDEQVLYPNTNDYAVVTYSALRMDEAKVPNQNGFYISGQDIANKNGETYIYVAIAEDVTAGEFPPTGTLTADADDDGPTITLTDVTGTWEDGMEVINDTEATQYAPDPESLEFVGSVPAASSGTIDNWGNATWEINNPATNIGQSTAKPIVPGEQQTLSVADSGVTLENDTIYDVTVKYDAPDAVAVTSDANRFKTAAVGDGWFPAKAAIDNNWQSVTYGDGKFVAVAPGAEPKVMYSADGISWTEVSTASTGVNYNWYSVTYGELPNGTKRFVAVANNVAASPVMYSDDGVNWTQGSGGSFGEWVSVTYGDGKFVAIASSAVTASDQVMYSTDGISWTLTSVPDPNIWEAVTYGELADGTKRFVAVRSNPASGLNQVMYSPNGINWNSVTAGQGGYWTSVTCGDGMFVAVSSMGSYKAMYSTDAINWTITPIDDISGFASITYGDGEFVAVSYIAGYGVAYSPDGINWGVAAPAENNYWTSVTYGGDKFVAVSNDGYPNQVMYSFTGEGPAATKLFYDEKNAKSVNDVNLEKRFGIDPTKANLKQLGIAELTEQPTGEVDAYVPENGKYTPIRSYESELNRANARIAQIKQAFADRLDALETATTVEPTPTEPFAIDGYYPLYSTEEAANAASDAGTNHSHTLNGVEYYMPDGGTLYHGNYGDSDY